MESIGKLPAPSLVRNEEGSDVQASVATLKEQLARAARAVEALANSHTDDFKSFEERLRELLWASGRAAVTLFLAYRHERSPAAAHVEREGRAFRPAPAQARNLNTMFGVVRYWRTYLREVAKKDRHGFHPLDEELGLTGTASVSTRWWWGHDWR
jgi:hypothetical protein